MTTPGPVHTESEAHPWRIDIPDHPGREDSPEYRASRTRMNAMAAESSGLIYGSGPYQDHHGGSLWLKDASGWFMVRNLAGIEWSAQFCADPAKVDLLRQNARRLYALVAPEIAQELDPGGLLDTPITDADGVARWTDSIFNAGVPLRPGFHTGVLPSAEKPAGASEAVAETGDVAGVADASEFDGTGEVSKIVGVAGAGEAVGAIEEYVAPSETTAVTEASAAVEATTAAVAPVSRRGSGDACVHVLYPTPGSRLARRAAQARRDEVPLILGPDHPISLQAYIHQPTAAPDSADRKLADRKLADGS